jgi:hypothetical protein
VLLDHHAEELLAALNELGRRARLVLGKATDHCRGQHATAQRRPSARSLLNKLLRVDHWALCPATHESVEFVPQQQRETDSMQVPRLLFDA